LVENNKQHQWLTDANANLGAPTIKNHDKIRLSRVFPVGKPKVKKANGWGPKPPETTGMATWTTRKKNTGGAAKS
jgi:hypothetical protein